MKKEISIFTDGACSGNPGKGGWGAVLLFQDKKYQALLKGYNSRRKLSEDEEFYLPLLCQAASLRFLLTRLFDWVNTPSEANVVPKNPEEYITKHKYFKKLVKNIKYVEN